MDEYCTSLAPHRMFHVSERGNIEVFVPRIPDRAWVDIRHPVVWAVDAQHLVNYLLPRDCPRVAYRATSATTKSDRAYFLPGGSTHVLAIEFGWYERVTRASLWVYEFPPGTFSCVDETAGYYVSAESQQPLHVTRLSQPIDTLLAQGVTLRVMPSLQALAKSIASSSLAFSCIRMRNACDAS